MRQFLASTGILLLAASVGSASGQGLALSHPVLIFVGRVGAGDPGPQRLTIRSTPTPSCTWAIPTAPLPSWLSVTPPSGTGTGDVVVTASATGLVAGYYHAQLTMTCGTESKDVEVFLIITDVSGNLPPPPSNIPIPAPPPGGPPPGTPGAPPQVIRGNGTWARYLVQFSFIGFLGISGDNVCLARPTGGDHMIGVLTGFETGEQGVDVPYRGTMTRATWLDTCDARPRPASPGEADDCLVSLDGFSTMRVEFKAFGYNGGGGWLKAWHEGPGRLVRVGGTCDAEVTNNMRNDYPGSESGGGASPNGQPIYDQIGGLGQPRLFAGGQARLREGLYPAKHPESAWSMRVIARLVP